MGSGLFAVGWHDMLALNLPLLEKIIRPIVVYVFLLIALRVAGKRELAQLNPFDLVVLLMLSNTVQNAIIGDDNSVTGGVIGAAALLAINYGAVRYFYFHRNVETQVVGDETPLIQHGQKVRQNLRKQLITDKELLLAARRQGFDTIHEVDTAILEPGGLISFKRKEHTPDDERQDKLMEEIHALKDAIAELKGMMTPPNSKS